MLILYCGTASFCGVRVSVILKMDAVCSSKTLPTYQTIWCHNPSFHQCKSSVTTHTWCSIYHRTPVTYGPAPHPGYSYGPPKVPPLSYYPGVQFVGNASSGGYPDRRYKLPPQFLGADPYLYTTLLQPATQYNPDDWWERQATHNRAAGRKWEGCAVLTVVTAVEASLILIKHIAT